MQQKRIQIPDSRDLREQLEVFEYTLSEINQDRMKLHAAEGYHDDEVDALALMTYGLTKRFGYLSASLITGSIKDSKESVVEEGTKANMSFIELLRKKGIGTQDLTY